jgi:hypothetical protein
MAGMNVGDLVEINVLSTLFAQKFVTTFPYRVSVASGVLDPITAEGLVAGDWKVGAVSPFLAYKACLPPELTVDYISVQIVQPVRWRAWFETMAAPGTDTVSTTSTNQAATITRTAKLSGRKYVGSIHIPGVAGGNIVDGILAGAFIAKMSTVASRMLNVFPVPTDGFLELQPVIVHRVWNPVTEKYEYDGNSDTYTAVAQDTARVMRRRTIGVGK